MALKYDVDRAKRAVQYLADTPYFPHRLKSIHTAVAKPRAMPFDGEAECLNELLVIGRQNLQAMENLINVAAFRRDTRNDKSKELMAERRAREKLAVQAEETQLGRKLERDERVRFIAQCYATWNTEKDAYVAARSEQYKAMYGEDPSGTARYAFMNDFWVRKDEELKQDIARVQAVQSKFRRVKASEVVKQPTSAIGLALVRAVDKKT